MRPTTIPTLLRAYGNGVGMTLTNAQCKELYDYIRELEDADVSGTAR